jgi:glucose-6-phosphate isomerase
VIEEVLMSDSLLVDIRIETLLAALLASDISQAEKDALADDLEYAQSINGSPDATLQGIKRAVISGVRREMLAHQRLKKHESDCPFRRGGVAEVSGSGVAKALAVIRALTPFRWPAAIAIFSPFAGDVIARVLGFFAK